MEKFPFPSHTAGLLQLQSTRNLKVNSKETKNTEIKSFQENEKFKKNLPDLRSFYLKRSEYKPIQRPVRQDGSENAFLHIRIDLSFFSN